MSLSPDVAARRIPAGTILQRGARWPVQSKAVDQTKAREAIQEVAVPAPVGLVKLCTEIQITSEDHPLAEW